MKPGADMSQQGKTLHKGPNLLVVAIGQNPAYKGKPLPAYVLEGRRP